MDTDDVTDGASVFSSIFYAKKNPPIKQQLLLNLSSNTSSVQSPTQTNEHTISLSSQHSLFEELVEQKETTSRQKKAYKPQRLSKYYPEIPPVKEEVSPQIKPHKRRKIRKPSPTRQLFLSAIKKSKKKISSQPEGYLSKKPIRTRKRKEEGKKKRIIQLNHFVSEEIIRIIEIPKTKTESTSNDLSEARSLDKSPNNALHIPLESSPDLGDPFPFTTITEWLIWHNNHPELAFVREAYDINEVPDDEDVEVFWVNVMNEPEFFNPNWRIAGLSIDIKTVRFQGGVERAPEWDILSSDTDCLSIFFEDIYQILAQNPHGLKDYRYPILRFALKGLALLDLAFFNEQNQKWFSKGTVEDLTTRLKELDQFISQQEDIPSYQQTLKTLIAKNEWSVGLICFDLIVIGSFFLSKFSQNRLTEDEKIQVIIKEAFNQTIANKLTMIEKVDQLKIRNLLKKLKVRD